jgi:hypothetical protein
VPAARSRTRKEDNRDYHPDFPGRVPAGRRGRGAADPGADGSVPDDLAAAPRQRPTVPTFAEYVPVVSATVTDGTRKAYGSYWNRVTEHWASGAWTNRRRRRSSSSWRTSGRTWCPRRAVADTRLGDPLGDQPACRDIKTNATPRRNARGGHGAAEHLIGALPCMYNHAVADRLLPEAENPAARVRKPRRLPSARMALPDARLSEITQLPRPRATTRSLTRYSSDCTSRRPAGVAARSRLPRKTSIRSQQCLIRLRDKGGTERWQPVSPTLMAHLMIKSPGWPVVTRRGSADRSACGPRPVLP